MISMMVVEKAATPMSRLRTMMSVPCLGALDQAIGMMGVAAATAIAAKNTAPTNESAIR
jgi:hypothetical protein